MTEREQFEAWAKAEGYDTAHAYDTDRSRWLFLSPMTADLWRAWQASAQTAQAVPASCGECGKKTSDGWALYCVACWEKAGLPAQAVPLLTDAEIDEAADDDDPDCDYVCGFYNGARWAEAAVRAKLGVAQWQPISTAPKDGTRVMVWMNDKYASNQHAFAKLWFYADGRLGGGAEGYSGDWSISHWMPLPPPPIVGKEGA